MSFVCLSTAADGDRISCQFIDRVDPDFDSLPSEARPQKFNSRLRNKMFYGQAGGKDLLQRKWKDLSEFVTLECDGKDITAKLREQKVHAVLFLNIPSYGGGTHPWNRAHGQDQATDDGLIEVVGLTTYQLVFSHLNFLAHIQL